MPLPPDAKALAFVMTHDPAASLSFYRDVLGLAVLGEDAHSVTLAAHCAVLHLTTARDHQPSPHPVLGWQVPDLTAVMSDLAAKDVPGVIYDGFGQDALGIWTSPNGLRKLAWITDPDGNLLCLMEDRE